MSNQPIYLDYNATTPVDEQVLDTMLPYFSSKYGNASSKQHTYGWDAEEGVDHAREQVAKAIGSKPAEIIFTSGATEAISLGLIGSFQKSHKKKHIITCKTEHKAVLDTCAYLESLGAEITFLSVDKNGVIDLGELRSAITDQTLLVCLMYANNETGVLQPVGEIGAICREREVLFFSDATQALGKIPIQVIDDNIDLAAYSAHKMYGPKGIGGLFIGARASINPLQFGGGHEKGLRSGTLNVPGIVGFGKACEIAKSLEEQENIRLGHLRDWLEKELMQLGSVVINGAKSDRLAHVTNVSFEDVEGSKLMRALKSLAISQGSACNSAVIEPSHVLKAMGVIDRLAYASLRISLGRQTTEEEVRKASKIIRGAIEQQRMQLQ